MKHQYFIDVLLVLLCLCGSSCFGKSFYLDYEEGEGEPEVVVGLSSSSSSPSSSSSSSSGAKNLEDVPINQPIIGTGISPAKRATNSESSWSAQSENSWDGNNGLIRHPQRLPNVNSASVHYLSPENPSAADWSDPAAAAPVRRPSTLPARLFPLQQFYSFQPSSSSLRRRSANIAMRKRQSILYRQCFFNPISCFRK